ncbi:hypothetical protein KKA00_03885, partial [bacterium]|nr:hypothetical protein [bacterium]
DFMIKIGPTWLFRSDAKVSFKPYEIVFCWDSGTVLRVQPLFREMNYLRFKLEGVSDDAGTCFYLLCADPAISANYTEDFQLIHSRQQTTDSLWFGLASLGGEFHYMNRPKPSEDRAPTLAAYMDGPFDLVFIYAPSEEIFHRELDYIQAHPEEGVQNWKDWLLDEINISYFRCDNERINHALNWAKISLAQLWAENNTALWAGLPWFNDCWGRDTFISFAGACLVQGKFDQAKALLERFAKWQCKDRDDPNWGRIPNRARFGDISYNTADGTPWFVKGVYDYGLYSGDFDLWEEFIAEGGAVRIATEGTLKYHTDSLGFLTHGEAETWMDAVGPDGPWSPRGNRAVEVQALWEEQLRTSHAILKTFDQTAYLMGHRWDRARIKLGSSFVRSFVRSDSLGLYDHLNSDGTPDEMIRPNQLFVLSLWNKAFEDTERESIINTVRSECIYSYGVASLAQIDPDFHPYHQHVMYPKDEAYHMGVVWTWLSGAYKSAVKGGWTITSSEIDQILDLDAPGTLSELLDAVPREGVGFPRPSGTVSQAWSLAEFIRVWYQDYIGLNQYGSILPKIPEAWGSFNTILNIRGGKIWYSVDIKDEQVSIKLESLNRTGDSLFVTLFVDLRREPYEHHPDRIPIIFDGTDDGFQAELARDGKFITFLRPNGKEYRYQLFLDDESPSDFLQPAVPVGLKALQLPAHRLLTGTEIKASDADAVPAIDIADDENDDMGDGGYIYPTSPEFKPGIFDITRLRISADDQNIFFKLNFRNLTQPGWHPEYGFQLTYVAICLQTGKGETSRDVGHNSGWTLPEDLAADRFVIVGGGIQVENSSGEILCEYKPADPKYAFGNPRSNEIAFAIPREYLPGDPKSWKITLLVGAQDDHGGAGIGEFREVGVTAERWKGGGGGAGKSNVYDWLRYPKE